MKKEGITLDEKTVNEECLGENGIISILNRTHLNEQAVQKSGFDQFKNLGGKSRKKRYNKSRKSKKKRYNKSRKSKKQNVLF